MTLKQTQGSPILSFLLGAGGLVLLVLGLRTASSILNPIILALVLTLAFRPILSWLQNKGLPTGLAFLLTLLIIVVGVAAVILILVVGLNALIETLPTYQSSAAQQQTTMQNQLAESGINLDSIMNSIDISKLYPLLEDIAKLVVQSLSGTFMMLFILAFMLVETTALPKKIASIKATSHPFMQTFANFGADIRKYITVLTGINFLVGVGDAIFLAILGVDYPILWGLVAFLLGYIPSIGFWFALIPPFLLAYAQFGIEKALLVLVGYVLINGSIQNIVQPKLMGDAVDLSPLVVISSLFIWTWIIGPLGALLAVPLTMAVQKLILQPYDSSRWLAELMGAVPPDKPEGSDVAPAPD